jgi:hypothetical protein
MDLTTGVTIEVTTATVRAPRGRTLALFVGDECAYWPADETGANPAVEVLRAVRPGLATTNGMLCVITSPYTRTGPVFEAFDRYYGKDDDGVLVWKAASRVMNPLLDQRVIDDALARDEEAARAEWLAEWRTDEAALVTTEALRTVTRGDDAPTRPPHEGEPIVFVDVATGGGSDSFAIGVAVKTHDPGVGPSPTSSASPSTSHRSIRPRSWASSPSSAATWASPASTGTSSPWAGPTSFSASAACPTSRRRSRRASCTSGCSPRST